MAGTDKADKYYANSTARIADEGEVPAGWVCEDNDTGSRYRRTSSGWVQVNTGGAANVHKGSAAISGIASVTALADVLEIDVKGYEKIAVEVAVTTTMLSGFVIQGRPHASAGYETLYSLAAEYTADPLQGLLEACSKDLTTIAAGTTGFFIMSVHGLESVKLRASSGGTAGITVLGTKVA